jgi:hypothetical protein
VLAEDVDSMYRRLKRAARAMQGANSKN